MCVYYSLEKLSSNKIQNRFEIEFKKRQQNQKKKREKPHLSSLPWAQPIFLSPLSP
jgi:hypothetical protein